LTTTQIKAKSHFQKKPKYKNIKIHNNKKQPFVDCKADLLIDWLVNEKSFNRDRLTKLLGKVMDL
jgi:hypothetical protein